jgi:Restriction endonuclease
MICRICQEEKPETRFAAYGKNRRRRLVCMDCQNKCKRNWYQKNLEHARASSREHATKTYHRNREKYLAKMKEWREANREWRKNNRHDWHLMHKAAQNLYARKYYQDHKKEIHAAHKRWRLSDPTLSRWHANVRHQRLKKVPVNDLTREQWLARCEEFHNHCAYCWKTGVELTIDHMIPIVAGGSHTLDNIVPACKSCNAAKSHRSLLETLRLVG